MFKWNEVDDVEIMMRESSSGVLVEGRHSETLPGALEALMAEDAVSHVFNPAQLARDDWWIREFYARATGLGVTSISCVAHATLPTWWTVIANPVAMGGFQEAEVRMGRTAWDVLMQYLRIKTPGLEFKSVTSVGPGELVALVLGRSERGRLLGFVVAVDGVFAPAVYEVWSELYLYNVPTTPMLGLLRLTGCLVFDPKQEAPVFEGAWSRVSDEEALAFARGELVLEQGGEP
jgi:hypothetical protein